MARYVILLSILPAAVTAGWLLVGGSVTPARPTRAQDQQRSLSRVTEHVHANVPRQAESDLSVQEDPEDQPLAEPTQTAPAPESREASAERVQGAVFIGQEVEPDESANDDPTSQPETVDEQPADLTKEEEETRDRERTSLNQRWTGQEPSAEATEAMHSRLGRALEKYNLDEQSLKNVDCRKAICRFELVTSGTLAIDALTEVNRLGRAARDLGDTWLATTKQDGAFHIEVFAAAEGHTLTGPDAD